MQAAGELQDLLIMLVFLVEVFYLPIVGLPSHLTERFTHARFTHKELGYAVGRFSQGGGATWESISRCGYGAAQRHSPRTPQPKS